MVKRLRWWIVVGFLAITSACQSTPTAPSPTPSPSPSASPLAACPAIPAPTAPQFLLQNQPAPDDLAFDSHGRLLISDITAGTVSALNPDGSVERIAGGLSAPEGIVLAADGRILIAEQGRNRIVAIDAQTHAVTQWRTFPNRTGQDGIDGIGPVLPAKDSLGNLLPTGDNVIVPDSPNGVVWRVSADGKSATQIASGMVRPVGAAVDRNSTLPPAADPFEDEGYFYENEIADIRERIVQKLHAMRRRERPQLIARGWSYDESWDREIPPGWVKGPDWRPKEDSDRHY